MPNFTQANLIKTQIYKTLYIINNLLFKDKCSILQIKSI